MRPQEDLEMDPLVLVLVLLALGVGLLVIGSSIRSRSLFSADRRRRERERREGGRIGWLMLWLLGVPIPVLLVLFLLRGCT
jgi:hypothetical protein